jgi:hypothetical protein
MKNEQIKAIAKSLQGKYPQFDNIGIRIQEKVYRGEKVGKIARHVSRNWDDGKMLKSQVNGICAIDISQAKYIGEFGGYDGNVVIVLGSNSCSSGEDIAEIIMREAVILEVIQ